MKGTEREKNLEKFGINEWMDVEKGVRLDDVKCYG